MKLNVWKNILEKAYSGVTFDDVDGETVATAEDEIVGNFSDINAVCWINYGGSISEYPTYGEPP